MANINSNSSETRFRNAEKAWLKLVDFMEEMKACKIAPDGKRLIPVIPTLRIQHSVSNAAGKRSEGRRDITALIAIDGNAFNLVPQGSASYKLRYTEDYEVSLTKAGVSTMMRDFGLNPKQYAKTLYKSKPLDASALDAEREVS